MLAGGIVAHVEAAAGDDLGEAGEASVPEGRSGLGLVDRAFDAGGFFATGAFVDDQREVSGEEGQEVRFKGIGDALGGIFANSQADGDIGGGG